jgi:SAM-dependent MidA family methyltransferase
VDDGFKVEGLKGKKSMGLESSQPLNPSTSQPQGHLALEIRDQIERDGPITFDRFMSLALYHPQLGYYSSGRCSIGRGGDYFTSVSVGFLFGTLLAGQFAEIWETLGRPDDFVIVEQGAHQGEFAADVLEALRARHPEFFMRVLYRIVEPFPILRERQEERLRKFGPRVQWVAGLETMPPFVGVHFSNELLDAMPVHLLAAADNGGEREWQERLVDISDSGFVFITRPISDLRLRERLTTLPAPPAENYETEINLATRDWIETLSRKLERGVVLIADYGFPRNRFYAPHRISGTLQAYAQHRALPTCFENIGECDLSTHVEWTSLAERAVELGLTIVGFADQHHFLTGLLSTHPELASAATEKSRALQTLIHPEFLGTKFQFLGLAKNFPKNSSLGGFKFASRLPLGLD